MWKMKLATGALAVLAVAGCGTAAAQTHARPAAHQVAAAQLPAMTHTESVQDCAALALARTSGSGYALEVRTVAGQSGVSQHVAAQMIGRNVHQNCPAEVSVLP